MTYSLFLYSDSPDKIAISEIELADYLIELDFLSRSTSSGTLLPGKLLMDYITFLGCSPSLKLGEIESTIRVHHFDITTGMGGESIETIRYPQCKHPVHDPAKLLKSYSEHNYFQCPTCGNKGKIDRIKWRKTAGFSTVFIEISQIFPKEAVPSDKLLNLLNNLTNTDWNVFYSTTRL